MIRLSSRVPPHGDVNALSRRLESMRADGIPYIDLTESNPTRVGLPYPQDLLDALAQPAGLTYEPTPFGLAAAREAIAADCLRRGARVDPSDVILTASTSESYSWLFKLLCDPGDAVLVPQPSYPLVDHLTRLESVHTIPYALEYHGRWSIDFTRIVDAPAHVRAVLVVSPNNPTGSYVSRADCDRLMALCLERGWALIVDEVFADYALDADRPVTDIAADAQVLCFSLGGASKALGLPQVKLGWIVMGGPRAGRDHTRAALELIADTFLSVSTPVQLAAPSLLRDGARVRKAIQERVASNLNHARALVAGYPACELLRTEGGWSAAIRIPATQAEEQFVLQLLEREGVLVHPGYFFDFPHEAYVVVSLLPAKNAFVDGCARLLRHTRA
jgi:aspartate/methionine/tyrosine aminotransferase